MTLYTYSVRRSKLNAALLVLIALALASLLCSCDVLGAGSAERGGGNPGGPDAGGDDDSAPTIEDCESELRDAFDDCFANLPPPPPDECLVNATGDYVGCLEETGEFSGEEIACGQECVSDARSCLDDCADDPMSCGPCVAQMEPCMESCGLPFPFDFGADDDDDDVPDTLDGCIDELHEDLNRCCYSGEFYYACFVDAVYEYLDCVEGTGELDQDTVDCGRGCADVAQECVDECRDEGDIALCESCLADLSACLLLCGLPLQ